MYTGRHNQLASLILSIARHSVEGCERSLVAEQLAKEPIQTGVNADGGLTRLLVIPMADSDLGLSGELCRSSRRG